MTAQLELSLASGSVDDGPTATEALAAAGYAHRREPSRTERDGRVKARLLAREVWSWLARRERKLRVLRGAR